MSLREVLSTEQLLTRRGLSNLIGEIVFPLQGALTTGLILESGELLAGTEDKRLLRVNLKSQEIVCIKTPRMVTALHQTRSSGKILVGMNQGVLAELHEDTLVLNKSFLTIPTRKLWHTPWNKNDYDIHSFVEGPEARIVAAIHVGGLVESHDDGKTWKQLPCGMNRIVRTAEGDFDVISGPGLNPDVHQVLIHPTDKNLLLAATRDGFYVSEDSGENFEPRNHGIVQGDKKANYQRSFAVLPESEVWLVASAEGPGELPTSRLYRSDDRGGSWHQVNGLPHAAPHIDTIKGLSNGKALALVGNEIYLSEDWGQH